MGYLLSSEEHVIRLPEMSLRDFLVRRQGIMENLAHPSP